MKASSSNSKPSCKICPTPRAPDPVKASRQKHAGLSGQAVRAFSHTFGDSGPNGGFGVWRLCPPNPALAGNADHSADSWQGTLAELKLNATDLYQVNNDYRTKN
jgi:hypothetical protein